LGVGRVFRPGVLDAEEVVVVDDDRDHDDDDGVCGYDGDEAAALKRLCSARVDRGALPQRGGLEPRGIR
jgi:hypothetical protein